MVKLLNSIFLCIFISCIIEQNFINKIIYAFRILSFTIHDILNKIFLLL